jgi:acetyl esterase/lipase
MIASAAILSAQVRVVRDIPYVDGSPHPKHRLDIYIPAEAKSAPVLFWIHGGALTSGDRADSDNPPVGQRFAAAGFVTVVISYRLSPEVSHPAHMRDSAKAFAWTLRNISKHGGNTEQRMRAVLPVSGFYHIDRVAPDRPKSVWGEDKKVWLEASPSQYVRKDLPPVLLVYADGDEPWRRQEHRDYAQELRAVQARVEIKEIRNRDHMGILYRMSDQMDETTQLMLDFMRKILASR